MNEMPLNDRDFAEIRGNVMREIGRRKRRNAVLTFASVAFAVVAIVFVLVPRPQQKPGGEGAAAPLRTPPPVAQQLSGAAAPPPPIVATAQIKPFKHHKPHRARKPQPIAIASNEQQPPLTIELQTANPDVRIIWIAK